MNTYNSITPIQGHNLLRPILYEEKTYSAHWASILATPPKADEQKKNETPLRTDQLTMSEGRPNLNSSNTHKVAHGSFVLEAFVIVVFAPGAAQAISKRCHSHRFCFFGVCPSLFRGCVECFALRAKGILNPTKIKTLSYQGRGIWGHRPGVEIEIPYNTLQFYSSLPARPKL